MSFHASRLDRVPANDTDTDEVRRRHDSHVTGEGQR